MKITPEIIEIGEEMKVQHNRHTSFPVFYVVEDKKVWGIDSNYADGKERPDGDTFRWLSSIETGRFCEACDEQYLKDGEVQEECEDCPDDTFNWYRVERDVPSMHAGMFFTAKACDEHIQANKHHYNETARSYAFSAYHNHELKAVMTALVDNQSLS